MACLGEFGFAQLFKFSQKKGYSAPVVFSTNYVTMAIALGVFHLCGSGFDMTTATVRVGMITGTVFVCSMFIMTTALRLLSVAPVLTAFRLAVVIPVILSVQIWGEQISLLQAAGIGSALIALGLMARGAPAITHTSTRISLCLIPLVFCAQGLSNSCLRWVHYAGLDNVLLSVLFFVGATAGTLGSIAVLLCSGKPTRQELQMGAIIGLLNLMALVVILLALRQIPGTVFFPAVGCTVVVMDQLSAHFIWKEPVTVPARWGALLAVVAMFLVLR